MRTRYWYLLGIALIVGICLSALVFSSNDNQGTDDRGTDQIQQIDPDYRPWYQQQWSLSGHEALLFSVQAGIGLAVIAFFIVRQRSRKKGHGPGDGILGRQRR